MKNVTLSLMALLAIALETQAAEPAWKPQAAAKYLDGRAKAWFEFKLAERGQGETKTSCLCCHTVVPYALARPALRKLAGEMEPTEWESKLIAQTRQRVEHWADLDTPA